MQDGLYHKPVVVVSFNFYYHWSAGERHHDPLEERRSLCLFCRSNRVNDLCPGTVKLYAEGNLYLGFFCLEPECQKQAAKLDREHGAYQYPRRKPAHPRGPAPLSELDPKAAQEIAGLVEEQLAN
jgi:hypothetical protein